MSLSDAEVAVATALAGAEVVARAYGATHVRFAKSATELATQTDVDAEAAIVRALASHRPQDRLTGEESGASGRAASTRRWLIDPIANEVFWTDGSQAYLRRGAKEQALVPSPVSGLVEPRRINCDGPLDRPFVGGQLVHDPYLRAAYSPRVISSTLGVAWVAAGRRAAYVSDGTFHENLHCAAGIAIAEAAVCLISDLAGNPLNTNRGLIVSAEGPMGTWGVPTTDRVVGIVFCV